MDNQIEKLISKGNTKQAKELLEAGVAIKNEMCIDDLVYRKECVSFLKLLDEKGYDLNQRGNILLFKAALGGKLKNTEFLFGIFNQNAEKDAYPIILTLMNLRVEYKKNPEKIKPMVDILVSNITEEGLRKSLEPLNHQHDKDYILYVHTAWMDYTFAKKEHHKTRLNKI